MNDFLRLKALFDELADLPPAERTARLAKSDIDETTRRQLITLFDSDVAMDGVTARRAMQASNRTMVDCIGRRVGAYTLDRELGSGGMGSVFLAHRSDGSIEQEVAVKLIRPEQLDENTLARFRLERQVLALLKHRNIATLHDVGELADGTPYVIMEYIHGQPILEFARHCDLKQRLSLFLAVCDAVSYAHSQMVVHRDLKSSNILVATDGQPKLLDFGIAKPLLPRLGMQDVLETNAAQRFLSPYNAAPEQLRGDPSTVGVDVYALGVLLYELLSDAAPFNFVGKTIGEIQHLILETDPPPPSSRAPEPLANKLRGDLDAIVLHTLRKSATDRYLTVERLADDIRNYLHGQPVAARRGRTWYRLRKFVGRHRVKLVAGAGILILLAWVCGLIFYRSALINGFDPTIENHSSSASIHLPLPDMLGKPDEALRSIWVEAEQKRFFKLLSGKSCDVLVVPFQSQHYAFDRATRSLMTAQLAHAISPDVCVVDPYIATRALGEGLRRIPEQAIQDLAKAVNALTVISTFVGHDSHLKLQIYVEVKRAVSWGYQKSQSKSWDVQFSDERPPFVAWQSLMPELLDVAGLKRSSVHNNDNDATEFAFPPTPAGLVAQEPANPLVQAKRFQVLAALGPVPEYRATERLYEKSWLAAGDASDSAESRRIQVRALLHLGYRPAALALLAGDGTPEGRVLDALLNGNLPDATKSAEGLTNDLDKVLAAIEIRDLGLNYDRVKEKDALPAVLRDQMARSDEWAALIDARVGELDGWHVTNNSGIKSILDSHYPIANFALRDVVTGAGALGRLPQNGEFDLLPTRHINSMLDQQRDRFCCSGFQLTARDLDFVELLEAQAQANVENEVNRTLFLQGRSERALDELSNYDAEFSGHPHFSLLRAQAYHQLIQSNGTERTVERTAAMEGAARSAAYWEQGTTTYSVKATMLGGTKARGIDTAYALDFPPRPYVQGSGAGSYTRRALNYATDELNPIYWLAPFASKAEDKKALLGVLDARFGGSPGKARLRATLSGAAQDEAQLRATLAQDPGNWQLYQELAEKLILNSQYAEAAKIVETYPGFKQDSGENAIALSNYAVALGSRLYWHGAIDPAVSILQIAARYQTGADAGILAQQRLMALDGDFAESSRLALERMQRYSSPWGARDYLCMLFAFGNSRDAWPAFMQAAELLRDPAVWQAAMAGQRIDGASDTAVRAWLTSSEIRNFHLDDNQLALPLALRYFMTDRRPPDDLQAFLASVEGAPSNIIDVGGTVMHPIGNASFQTVGTIHFNPTPAPALKERDHVRSPFVLFSEAYVAQQRGDHAAAVTALEHFAGLYPVEIWATSFVLPYFARSAALTGDKSGLKTYLDNHWPAPFTRTYEFYLTQAIFAGIAHQSDAAQENLRTAFNMRPTGDDSRPVLSEYEYAETCIWLFQQTGDTTYRDLALGWARSYQRLDPTNAWAYALEARFADTTDPRRTRAIAIAEYLDRGSFWLSEVPKKDREAAKAWLKINNPFRHKVAARQGI